MSPELAVFYLLAGAALGSAALVVLLRNPVVAAVWLVFHFAVLAALFLLLRAPFLSAVQLLIYAGAIMVLFLFVLMFLPLRRAEREKSHYPLGPCSPRWRCWCRC